jgi:DNA polymerase-3 subunit alpha
MKINKVSFEEHVIILFKTEKVNYQTPQLSCTALENAFDEIELLGFPLCSPFELLSKPRRSALKAKDLMRYKSKVITIEGYLVTTKNTRTSTGKPMYFGTFLDRDGDFVDTVHFPPVATKYPFRGKGIYTITGRVLEEFDCINIEVISMYRLAIVEDPRYADNSKTIAV